MVALVVQDRAVIAAEALPLVTLAIQQRVAPLTLAVGQRLSVPMMELVGSGKRAQR